MRVKTQIRGGLTRYEARKAHFVALAYITVGEHHDHDGDHHDHDDLIVHEHDHDHDGDHHDHADHVANLRAIDVTPHVTQNQPPPRTSITASS